VTDNPKRLKQTTVARSRLFRIDRIDLLFSNGEQRNFELIMGDRVGGVVVVPLLDRQRILLLKEYAAGADHYELGFVKGVIEADESAEQAARRELREEAGYQAEQLTLLDEVTLMPAYSNFRSFIYLATGLSPAPAEGDEPEALEPLEWPTDDLAALHQRTDMTDARTHLALHLVQQHLNQTCLT